MYLTRIFCTGLLSSVASVGLACDMPPLVAIPAAQDMGGNEAQIRAEVEVYFEAMRLYTVCIQDELAKAGGDSAPRVTRGLLVQRNNVAVAEAEAVMKIFTEKLGAAAAAAPQTP